MKHARHSLSGVVLVWSSFICNTGHCIEHEQISTDFGQYEIAVLPMEAAPFELVESKVSGVRSAQSTPNSSQLASFNTDAPQKVLASIDTPRNADWGIFQDQLYVAFPGELRVYKVPGLTEVARRQLAPVSPLNAQNPRGRTDPDLGLVRRLPGGWHCDGSVYDNSGEKLQCLLALRISSIQQVDRPSLPQPSAALDRWPLTIGIKQNRIALTGFPPNDNIVEMLPSKSLANPASPILDYLRIDGDHLTFCMGSRAVHLRVVNFNAQKAGLPVSQRPAFVQPAFQLKEVAVDTPYQFLDGPPQPVFVHFGNINDGSDITEVNVEARAQQIVEMLLGRNRNHSRDRASVEKVIQAFCDESAEEFKRATGRQPEGFPVPVRVSVRTTWSQSATGMGNWPLSYWVWAELPKSVLLAARFRVEADAERRAKFEVATRKRQTAIAVRFEIVRLALSILLILSGIFSAVLVFRLGRPLPIPVAKKAASPKQRIRPPIVPLEDLDD